MDNALTKLLLLRLNVIPPYTYDDDEGQRSDDEYRDFYATQITDAVSASEIYTEQYRLLAESPDSDVALARFLEARTRFIDSLPFCVDEFPNESSPDFAPTCLVLRSHFRRECQMTAIARDLESLKAFQELLRTYYWDEL